MRTLYPEEGSPMHPRFGPYFSDGRRRVDYVLTYHIQKPGSVRNRSSRVTENSFIRRLRRSLSMRGSKAPLQPKEDPEIAAQEQQGDYCEDDKRFKREEFEENLLDMGLEMERDEQVCILCVFECVWFFFPCLSCYQSRHTEHDILKAWVKLVVWFTFWIVVFFISQFLFQGHFPGIGFLKIHAPWKILCREAEFMKLKMPTKKVFYHSCSYLL